METVTVTIYAVDRHYGGPEEGGWYYNRYQKTSHTRQVVRTDEKIEAAKAELLALVADRQPERSIYSVLSDGPEYCALAEDYYGENESQGRPHYE